MNMKHMRFLNGVALEDVRLLREKESTYRGSWKRRGGIGAFMMLARKWDRLEQMSEDKGYDIFKAIGTDISGKDGSVLAEIRDLRCYLLLVEAELLSQLEDLTEGMEKPGTPEDGGHHELGIDDAEFGIKP